MRLLLSACLVALLALPASASAVQTNAPAGNSGLSQYLEVVPSSSGNTPSKTKSKAKSDLPAKVQTKLAASGDTGDRLSDFTSSSSPKANDAAARTLAAANQSKAGAVAGTLAGSDGSTGLGIWLPIAVVVLGALAIAGAWRRRTTDRNQ